MDFPAFDLDEAAVRARFEWALRNGNPRWLWPDVAVEAWQAALGQIETITRDVLVAGRSNHLLTGEPAATSVAALTSGMGPLLGYWLSEGLVKATPTVGAVLKIHFRHNEIRMNRMTGKAVAVMDGLAAAAVEAFVLKGMDTSIRYFPTPAVRPMSDVDLLIEAADEPKAATALQRMGFRPKGELAYPERTWLEISEAQQPKNLYFLDKEERWSIDLHLTLNLRHASVMPWIRLENVKSHAVERWRHSPNGHVLGQPGQLLHLAVHAGVDLNGLTMLRLVELAFVIRQDTASGALQWHQFLAAAGQVGALGGVFPALYFCEQLVPGTVPSEVLQSCRDGAQGRAVRFLESFTPATVHRVVRCSLEERYMWFPTATLTLWQILNDLLPLATVKPTELLEIYRMRLWRLVRRTVTR